MRLLRIAGAALLGTLAIAVGPPTVAVPTRSEPPRSDPTTLTQLSIPASPGSRVARAALPRTRTTPFSMVGVTWDRGTATPKVQIQIRQHGDWSGWRNLDLDDAHNTGRPGTEPLFLGGNANGVAVRVVGAAPSGLRVSLIAPHAEASDALLGGQTARAAAPTFPAKPGIISRAKWGARAPKSCDSPRISNQMKGVLVHHTAGSNRYSRAQSARIVRGIQAYHMRSRGWCDIGYNFLVDKYGRIFEGRAGGTKLQVRGAHAGNFDVNTYTTGISMMGNFDVARPSAALKNAMVRLVGWRLGTRYVTPKGSFRLDGHRLKNIAGHRDVARAGFRPATATACPGRYGYSWMKTGLIPRVSSYLSNFHSAIAAKAEALGRPTVGTVYSGEQKISGGRQTVFTKGTMWWKSGVGAHFVSGPALTEFDAWGSYSGKLGFPARDSQPDAANAQQARQVFEHGTIYTVGSVAYGVYGKVDAAYRDLGDLNSPLGAPIARSTVPTTGDQVGRFVHGTITYDPTTGQVSVVYA